jgi:membrane protein YfhO
VGHSLWAALGTWALGRGGLGLSGWAAWLAAAGWMACGPLLSLVPRWQHFAAAAWLPWVILAAHRSVARPSTRRVLALACVLAMQWLAGSVEMAGATLAVAACWTAARAWPEWPRAARAWLPAGLVAAGLTAAMWLPALDLLRHSARADLAVPGQAQWSVHPWRWIEILAPLRPDEMLLRPELRARLFGPTGTTIVPSLYLGAAMGGLVLCAFVASPRRRLVRGLAGVALVSALLATGLHATPVAWVAARLEALSILRFPGKMTLFLSFAWALLAGVGLDASRAAAGSPSRPRVLPRAAIAAGLPALGFATLAVAFPRVLAGTIVPPPPPGARVWDAVWLDALLCGTAAAAAAACAGAGWLAARRPRLATACVAAVALVAVTDLTLPNRRLNPMVRPELVGRPPETAQRLRADGASRVHVIENDPSPGASSRGLPGRREIDPRAPLSPPDALALGLNLSLTGRSASRWGLAGSYTLESLVAPTREQFALSRLFPTVADAPSALALLQSGAVSHVVGRAVAPRGLQPLATIASPLLAPVVLFRVPEPLPRAYVVGAVATGSDDDALRFLLDPGADRRGSVVLAEGPTRARAPGFAAASRVTRWRPDDLELEVEASSDACLVLVEAFDPGWTATVDDRPVRVRRANFGFRAVEVPPGRHEVRLRYRPRAVTAGLLVSAATIGVALLALVRGRSAMDWPGQGERSEEAT